MSHDEFSKLFHYMNEHFDAIDRRFDEMATKTQFEEWRQGLIDVSILMKPLWNNQTVAEAPKE